MDWKEQLSEYKSYLIFEKGVASNTSQAYVRDVEFFINVALDKGWEMETISLQNMESYLQQINEKGGAKSSQARMISSIRSFFDFLVLYDHLSNSVMDRIESPKIGRKIPDVLSEEEMERILSSITLDKWIGYRNRAMIETLYSCGLRVSELVGIRISDLFFEEGFLRVFGKGNKERLVPVSQPMVDSVKRYLEERRGMKTSSDTLFVNNRAKKLSREMIFMIVKKIVKEAGISKSISPHTFRHSFATALIKGGADIRVVQDMLGHESILTTEIYTHLDTRHKRGVLESFHPLSKK